MVSYPILYRPPSPLFSSVRQKRKMHRSNPCPSKTIPKRVQGVFQENAIAKCGPIERVDKPCRQSSACQKCKLSHNMDSIAPCLLACLLVNLQNLPFKFANQIPALLTGRRFRSSSPFIL